MCKYSQRAAGELADTGTEYKHRRRKPSVQHCGEEEKKEKEKKISLAFQNNDPLGKAKGKHWQQVIHTSFEDFCHVRAKNFPSAVSLSRGDAKKEAPKKHREGGVQESENKGNANKQ